MSQRQRNLNTSFREKDLWVLHDLKRRSVLEYVSTSGVTVDLIKKGMLYEKQQRTKTPKETGVPV